MLANRGLYAIVDVDVCRRLELDPVETGGAFLRAKLPWVQFRMKRGSDRERLALMRAIADDSRRTKETTLIANDRPDLAKLAHFDGVHVGQDDLSVPEVKALYPDLLVGVSTHRLSELESALASPAEYVAWGPLYPTTSKENPEPTVGEASLATVSELARSAGKPLVGIGGIDEARLATVAPFLEFAAMISAFLDGARVSSAPYEWVYGRAVDLSSVFRRAISER